MHVFTHNFQLAGIEHREREREINSESSCLQKKTILEELIKQRKHTRHNIGSTRFALSIPHNIRTVLW
jgi:hypothetical protein